MKINFILNGEDVTVDTNADTKLIDILRNIFALRETKLGCGCGMCGGCSVFLNGALVNACLVPAFKVRNNEVITIEGFLQTGECHDIISAIEKTGFQTCGFCTASKILVIESLITKNYLPDEKEILAAFQGNRCRCK